MWTFILSIVGALLGILVSFLLPYIRPDLFRLNWFEGISYIFVAALIVSIGILIGMIVGLMEDYKKARTCGKTIFSSFLNAGFGLILFILISILLFWLGDDFNPVLFIYQMIF